MNRLLTNAPCCPKCFADVHYASLSEQAAALLQSLANNHAFVDGNKRVAFATMAIFVRLNGFALRATADDAEAFVIDEVIQGRPPLARIATWIEEHLEFAAVE